MEPALVFSTVIVTFFIAITSFAIYTAFGPPSKELADPFEDHED